MKCENCGHTLEQDMKYCPNCGVKITKGEEASSSNVVEDSSNPSVRLSVKSMVIALASQAAAWYVLNLTVGDDEHFVLVFIIIPVIVLFISIGYNGSFQNQYDMECVSSELAIVQGLCQALPFLGLGHWNGVKPLIVICLVVATGINIGSMVILDKSLPKDASRTPAFLAQAGCAFGFGSFLAWIFAFVFALFSGGSKKRKK